MASFNRLDGKSKVGSIGLPVWGVQIRVVDPEDKDVSQGELGEIVVKGHNVMKGYYQRPEANETVFHNGWFHTGDIGRFDEEGYLYIVDRVKDMIIRGGYNVYPREIEEVLITYPGVSLVTVIGVPHDTLGEEIKAFIIPEENANLSEEALIEWSRENMAAYKYPRMIEIQNTLPMTATDKILKRELR